MSATAERLPLTRERVLAAAIALADSQGLDALTLRRLAETLQVHPTSIYNHVHSKDAILDGLVEHLVEQAQLPARVNSWQEWVWSFSVTMRALARDHPGAFVVFTRRSVRGPAALRHVEAALAAFRCGGFSAAQANQAMAGTALAIMGLALNEAPPPASTTRPLELLEAGLFPRIAEAVRVVPTTTDDMWELVIGALVAGLEGTVRGQEPPS